MSLDLIFGSPGSIALVPALVVPVLVPVPIFVPIPLLAFLLPVHSVMDFAPVPSSYPSGPALLA